MDWKFYRENFKIAPWTTTELLEGENLNGLIAGAKYQIRQQIVQHGRDITLTDNVGWQYSQKDQTYSITLHWIT